MVRYASILVVMVGCASDPSHRPPGTMPLQSAPFQMLLCTGGQPGDPTCPINHVELGAFTTLPGTPQLDFAVMPAAGGLNVFSAELGNLAGGLYLETPRLVPTPCSLTGGGGVSWPTIDVAPSTIDTMPLDAGTFASQPMQVCFDTPAIGAYGH
jgi:hypothetical protein